MVTALYEAAKYGQIGAIRLLFDHGANVNHQVDHNRSTALHAAAQWGSLAAAQLLLPRGAHVDAADKYGAIPLFLTATQRKTTVPPNNRAVDRKRSKPPSKT